MNKIIVIKIIFLLFAKLTLAQDTIQVFKDDSNYFKPLNKKNGFILQLRDSLPNGVYVTYNVKRENKDEKNKKPILIGRYVNFKREGKFFFNSWVKNDTHDFKLRYRKTIEYKNGKKHGIIKAYNICDYYRNPKIMVFQGEYCNGMKHGCFITFELGEIEKVEQYEKDKLVEVLYDKYKEP